MIKNFIIFSGGSVFGMLLMSLLTASSREEERMRYDESGIRKDNGFDS